MKITKKRDGEAWRIYVDSRPTEIRLVRTIYRADGRPWDVMHGPDMDSFMFDSSSLGNAFRDICRIMAAATS